MADIFISFIHEEEPVARAVRDFLEALVPGAKAFFSSDQWQVYAGEDWLKKICDALRAAKVVILLLSKESVARPWVNFEAGAGWLTDKHVIPACFKGLSKATLPKPYSSLQAINLNEPDDQHYLLHSVCHYLGKITRLTPPPPPFGGGVDKFAKEREPWTRLEAIMKAIEEGKPWYTYTPPFSPDS